MIRTLATLQSIRMIFIKREVLGTVIKGNGSAGYNDTAAKATIVALNHADHITFGVSGAEVNSAAVTRVTYNRLQRFIINQSTAVCGITLAQKLLGSNLHVGRLGNIFFSINKAQLHSFDLLMHCFYGIAVGKVIALENIQRHKYSNTMTVRRQLPDIVAAIVNAQRFNPFRFVGFKVALSQEAVMFLHKSINLICQLTFIESITIGFGNQAQAFSHIGILEYFARLQPMSVRLKGIKPAFEFRSIFIFGIEAVSLFPQAAHVRRNRIAVFRIVDGWFHNSFDRQLAKLFMNFHPRAYSTRNVNRLNTIGRNFIKATFLQGCDRSSHRSRTAAVNAIQLTLIPDKSKAVTAQAIAGRFNYWLTGCNSNSGINCVTALKQGLQACGSSGRITYAYHTVFSINNTTFRSIRIILCIKFHCYSPLPTYRNFSKIPAVMTEKVVTVAKPPTRYFGIMASLTTCLSSSVSPVAIAISFATR